MTARETEAVARRSRRDTSRAAAASKPSTRPRRRATGKAPPRPKPTWRISSSGARFGLFSYKYLRQTKGIWAGHPLALEPFQIVVMSDLLQVEHEQWLDLTDADAQLALLDPATFWERVERWRGEEGAETYGLRIHREGLLGIPKKNGKSTMSAGLALYLLIADGEPGAEVYSTASTKPQASIVFRQAKEMVEKSPKLLDHVKLYHSTIELRKDGSFYRVVSADAPGLEGINPHGVVNDEIHAHKSRELYDVLRTATIAREQPILFSITTAGFDLETIGGELYLRGAGRKPKYVHKHEAGQDVAMVEPVETKQRSFYFRWYQANPAKAEDIAEVKAANPASFITTAKLQEESDVNRPRGIYYRYHGNLWTRVETHWLKPGSWERLRGRRGDESCEPYRRGGEEEIVPGDSIVVFVDVGQMHDTSAIVWARPPRLGKFDDPEDPVAVDAWVACIWPDPKDPDPTTIAKAHYAVQTDEPLRLDLLENYIIGLGEAGYRILAVGADPMKFETQLQNFEDRGLLAIRFDQTAARMVPASEGLYRGIANRLIAHNGNEVLASHLEAAAARDVGGGRWRLDKRLAADVMDGAIGLAGAYALATNEEVVNFRRPTIGLL